MPSKVYVEAPPDGDFRAMPAAGGGYAVLKWVTSFPGQSGPRPSDGDGRRAALRCRATGELLALLDAGAVTALRTGAAAVLAAETLARPQAGRAAVVGCGVNGTGRGAHLPRPRPRGPALRRTTRAGRAGRGRARAGSIVDGRPRRGARLRRSRHGHPGPRAGPRGRDAAARPARQPHGRRRARQGRRSIPRSSCAPGSSATSGSRRATTATSPGPSRPGASAATTCAELGLVLSGAQAGRRSDDEITAFDSTGLAVQDLAVALAVYERYRAEPGADAFAGVTEIELR